jgi:predicted ATP-grasp superfamily ATP-dependent carboligase
MSDETRQLNQPWFVAVWPGMGQVAVSAGYYMMAKLGMHLFAEFSPNELFDVEHVEVEGGIIRAGRLPRSRCFLWRDPKKKHDIILFIGEAQPPSGKRAFCQALVRFAKSLGVERFFTFAAMATQMHPEKVSRVFGAATNAEALSELTRRGAKVLEEGHIGGLNGVVLGEAAAAGVPGACLLGEMPHIFAQIPFPGAALAVLKVFSSLADVTIDLDELIERSDELGHQLGEVLAQVEGGLEAGRESPEEEDVIEPEPVPENKLSIGDEQRIEAMFVQARADRSKAFELKQELDRLGVFQEYEDAFLNLFQKPE